MSTDFKITTDKSSGHSLSFANWFVAAAGNGVRMDPLQRLHTLVNLAALLAGPLPNGASLPRTLRDDRLLVLLTTSIKTYDVQVYHIVRMLHAGFREWRAEPADGLTTSCTLFSLGTLA